MWSLKMNHTTTFKWREISDLLPWYNWRKFLFRFRVKFSLNQYIKFSVPINKFFLSITFSLWRIIPVLLQTGFWEDVEKSFVITCWERLPRGSVLVLGSRVSELFRTCFWHSWLVSGTAFTWSPWVWNGLLGAPLEGTPFLQFL